jgi:dTMP kinase
MAGLFVVFEGITGSGKKTRIRQLADRLRGVGKKVVQIGFPDYENEIARVTRHRELDAYTASLLHAADRSNSQERIKNLLDQDSIVLCDRYCYSNFAYQSSRGISLDWLQAIEKNLIKPRIVFLIDVTLEVGMKRVEQANIEDFTKKEILTRLQREREFLERIRQTYLQLAHDDKESKWCIIDGTLGTEKNNEQIWEFVRRELE